MFLGGEMADGTGTSIVSSITPAEGNSPDNEDEVNEVEVPDLAPPDENWMPFNGKYPLDYKFSGFLTFFIFGPHTQYLSFLISTSRNSKKKKSSKSGGKAHQRDEEAKRARMKRERGNYRSITIQTKV